MKYTFLAIFLMLGATVQAQYKVSFVKPTVNGSKFSITLKMSAESRAFNLGANNLRFNYPTQNLANPVIISEQFPASAFGETTLLGSNPKAGIVSVNTSYKGKTNAKTLKINNKGVELVTIQFDILKPIENAAFTMRIEGAQPKTSVLMDDAKSIVKLEVGEAFEVSLKNTSVSRASDNGFYIAPNPTNGIANLSFQAPSMGSAEISVYNNVGQLMQTITDFQTYKGKNQTTIDLSVYPVGLYHIRITQSDEIQTLKLQKI
jgi:hypothetical protein